MRKQYDHLTKPDETDTPVFSVADFTKDIQSLINNMRENKEYLSQSGIPYELQNIRAEFIKVEDYFDKNFIIANDGAAISKMRCLITLQLIEHIMINLHKLFNINQSRLAVIAVGGCAKGHLFLNSDLDITVLHHLTNREEAENIFRLLSQILIDSLPGIIVAPVINTLGECKRRWNEDFSTLVSTSFSRFIFGNEASYFELKKNWVQHIKKISLEYIIDGIRHRLITERINSDYLHSMNIKHCAGGIIELTILQFIEKLLHERGQSIYPNEEVESKLNTVFHFFMCLRESVYRTNKTYFISNKDVELVAQLMAKQGLCRNSDDSFIKKLTQHRTFVRDGLIQFTHFS